MIKIKSANLCETVLEKVMEKEYKLLTNTSQHF